MPPLERYSLRVGAAVNMAIRMFEPGVGEEKYRPAVGVGAWKPGDPELWEEGSPGQAHYRRIWTVAPPKNAAASVQPPVSLAGMSAQEANAVIYNRGLPAQEAERAAAARKREKPCVALLGAGSDAQVLFPNVLARKIDIHWNSHRVADELDIELPLAALPLPPDGSVIRSILIEVRVGVIGADAWARAMSELAVSDTGRPLSLPVADDSEDPAFTGFVDEHTLRLADSTGSTVRFRARDMAGVLADEQCRGRAVETDTEIDYAIARLLSTMPSMAGMEVVWLGPESPPSLGGAGPKWKRRTSKKGKSLPLSPKVAKESILDLVTEACILAGCMPRFVGYRLELAPVRTLDQYAAKGVPRMVLGRNIVELELTHKLTQAHAKAVEVHSMDPDTGNICVGRWPPDPKRAGGMAPGANHAAPPTGSLNLPPGASAADEQSPEVVPVENVTDPKRLQAIARNYWEERARQDVTGKFVTCDVATIEGRAQGVADLLSLRAGDPISIVIAPDVEQAAGSYLQRVAGMTRSDAIKMLRSGGWTEEVAEKIVDAIQIAKRPLIYRVREASLKLDMGGSTEIEVQLQSFIEILDNELKGGNRARLAASGGEPSFEAKWQAIEGDRLAGELSTPDAMKLQEAAGHYERGRQAAAAVGGALSSVFGGIL